MTPSRQPEVLVVHPYWDFWESSVAGDLPGDRRALLDEAMAEIGRWAAVRDGGVIGDPESAVAAAAGHADVDAVVVVCSMAVPAATGMALLDALPGLPVVLWAVSRRDTLDGGFSHSQITTDGAPVGTPMLSSALARQGRPFRVVSSTLASPGALGQEIRRAVAAGRLRSGTLLVVGQQMPGYTSVVPPTQMGKGFNPRLARVSAAEFASRTAAADPAEVARLRTEVHATSAVAENVDPVGLERALAAEVALRELLAEHSSSAGAVNCHLPELRPNAAFGIAPCLALGRLTSEGAPFTCTGDVLTSVAMLAVQLLGLPTLYHEIEAIDFERNEVVVSNSGEFDSRLCPSPKLPLVRNVWYEHDVVNAPCATFTIAAGPASLVGFAYAPDPRFIVAEGEFTGSSFPSTGMPNAGFRFDSGDVGQAWPRWAEAGALHHSAATNARIGDSIAAVAAHLDIEFIRI